MAPPLLVFDLDGTLVDSAPDLLATLDAVLPRHGFRAPRDPGLREGIGLGALHLIETALAHQGARPDRAALQPIYGDFLAYYEANIARHSRLFAGTEALLDRFEAAGWRLAVCTNKKERLSRLVLEELGIAARFAAICGVDTFAACKPDPAHLTGTIEAAGGTPEKAVMVGDSRTDRDTALNAAIPFVGVSFGYTPVPMAALAPDLLVDDFAALTPQAALALLAARHAPGRAAPASGRAAP